MVRAIRQQRPDAVFHLGDCERDTQRLEKEFQKARKELAKVISGENKDLSHIKTDLDLVTALDDFPFSVSWELSRYDVMDSLGRLDQEKIREEDPENQGIGMNITGVLHYEDVRWILLFLQDRRKRFPRKSGFWNW